MDNELIYIKQCQNGQISAFGQLYDCYIEKIYKFIYYKTQHRETAEDLTSQTFFKALKKINSFNTGQGTFQAWIYQIARHTVFDYWRGQKPIGNIDDILDLADQENIERDLEIKMKLADVEKYLKQLNAEQREIIILRLWENLSYREIAEIAGKSEASCKMAMSRALQKLRAEMPLALFIAWLLSN